MTIRVAPIIAAFVALSLGPARAEAQERAVGGGFEARERFTGTLTLLTKQGQSRNLSVAVRHWAIRGGQKIDRFPEEGFKVVQLLAGSVTTIMDGRRMDRREGEFWTVPAGVPMAVETRDDTAVLHVMTVR